MSFEDPFRIEARLFGEIIRFWVATQEVELRGITKVTLTVENTDVEKLLGADAESLLGHKCTTIPASTIHLPGPDFIDRVWSSSDRPIQVLRSLGTLHGH